MMFAGAFTLLALVYTAYFNVIVRIDPDAAESRFKVLVEAGSPKPAVAYGERVLAMRMKAGAGEDVLVPLKKTLARAQIDAGRYERGATLYEQVLSSPVSRRYDDRERATIEDKLARAYILTDELARSVSIYATFLELASDEGARPRPEARDTLEAFYAARVSKAADLFAEALKPTGGGELFGGGREARLAAANEMAALGAFYAMRESGVYAAAGLLSAAYEIRRELLGGDHQDTVQLVLILGPVYAEMGRLGDAETIYLEAFHAQERVKGANNPDLSLYIRLLARVYERQGRQTEAQALYEHMRNLFRDAFGAQRYAVNREHDRRSDIDRPVSQRFPLPSDYAPRDLVSAADYSIPIGKDPDLEEMLVRLAPDAGADPREANLPVRLAQLMSLCRSVSGENISLRSGYRSFGTQKGLYQRIGYKGTVTPPGMSEHQLGLAADINVNGRLMRRSDRANQCFEENAFRFGFILSYPPGNDYLPGTDSFEPWHWRYIGVQTARLYREAGPINRPQEFLAALPCYQERAAAGLFPTAGEPDLCLSESRLVAATATDGEDAQPLGEKAQAARILNDAGRGARTR